MSFAVTVMQTLSAFVIFVAACGVLFVATICTVVLAAGIYKVCQLIRAYTIRTPSQPMAEPPHIEEQISES
jgi:hypothetical protein